MADETLERQGTFDVDSTNGLIEGDILSIRRGTIDLPVIGGLNDNHLTSEKSSSTLGTEHHVQPVSKQSPRCELCKEKKNPHFSRPPSNDKTMSYSDRETIEALYSERNGLLRSEGIYKRRIKQLEDEANKILETIDVLTRENKALRARTGSNSNDNKHDTRPNSTSDKGKAGSEIPVNNQKLEEQLANERKKNEKLSENLKSERQKTYNAEEKFKSEIDHKQKLIQENVSLEKEIERLKIENGNLFEDVVKVKDENYKNVKTIHTLEKEVVSLKANMSDVENKNSNSDRQFKQKIISLESEKKQLVDAKAMLQKNIANIEAEQQQKIFSLEMEKKEVLKTKENLEMRISTLEGENEHQGTLLQAERKKAIKLKTNLDKRIANLEQENKGLTSSISSLKNSVTDVENEKIGIIQELENKNKTLETENRNLSSLNKEMENRVSKLDNDNRTLKDNFMGKDSECNELRKKLEALKEQTENRISKLERDNKTLMDANGVRGTDLNKRSSELKDLEKEYDVCKKDRDKYKRKLDDLTKMYNELQDKHDDSVKTQERIKSANTKHLDELTRTRKSADRREREYKAMKLQIEQNEGKVTEFKSLIDKKDKECVEQRNENKKKSEELDKLKLQIDKLNNEIVSNEKENKKNKNLQSEIQDLKSELQNVKNALAKAKADKDQALQFQTEQHTQKKNMELNKATLDKQKFAEEKKIAEESNTKLESAMFESNLKIQRLEKDRSEWDERKKHLDEIESNNRKLTKENNHLRKIMGEQALNSLNKKLADTETRASHESLPLNNIVENETYHTHGEQRLKVKKNAMVNRVISENTDNDTSRTSPQSNNSLPAINESIHRERVPRRRSPPLQPIQLGGSYRRLHKQKVKLLTQAKQ